MSPENQHDYDPRSVMKQAATADAAGPPVGRRDVLRAATAGIVAAAAAGTLVEARPAASPAVANGPMPVTMPPPSGIRAFKLYTGADNASHVREGTMDETHRTEVIGIHFKETPAHSADDWHDSPESQYVITLSGTLEFTTRDGATFVVRPGDILLSEDRTGSGHRWRLIDDQPWRRAYVVLKPGAKDFFVAKTAMCVTAH